MRTLKVATEYTVLIDEVEFTYAVTASFTPGSRSYFDRGYGNWLPGDPATLEDIDLTPLNGAPPVDYDALPKDEQEKIDEALMEAVDEEDAS